MCVMPGVNLIVATTCGLLTVPNAVTSYSNAYAYKSRADVTCNVGYTSSGSGFYATCDVRGQWSKVNPITCTGKGKCSMVTSVL